MTGRSTDWNFLNVVQNDFEKDASFQRENVTPDFNLNYSVFAVDDIGFEGLSINGSLSYKTPFLDELASNGVNFTNAISQPLCTPSRVKIITGKYN